MLQLLLLLLSSVFGVLIVGGSTSVFAVDGDHDVLHETSREGSGLVNQRMSRPQNVSKHTVKVFAPFATDLEAMDQVIGYLINEQRHQRCDHTITQQHEGPDILMDGLRRYYKSFKMGGWQSQDALQFMTYLNGLFRKRGYDLDDIERQTSTEIERKYRDQESVHEALSYFHSTCNDGDMHFNGSIYETLHGAESLIVSVAMDYFSCLFDAVVFNKVKMMRLVNDESVIWDDMPPLMYEDESYDAPPPRERQSPNEALMGELKRMDEIVAVLRKDIEDSAKCLSTPTADSINIDHQLLLFQLFDELCSSIADFALYQEIRRWVQTQDGSGKTICVAVDEIAHQTLDSLLLNCDDVKVEKWKAKWTMEKMPLLSIRPRAAIIADGSAENKMFDEDEIKSNGRVPETIAQNEIRFDDGLIGPTETNNLEHRKARELLKHHRAMRKDICSEEAVWRQEMKQILLDLARWETDAAETLKEIAREQMSIEKNEPRVRAKIEGQWRGGWDFETDLLQERMKRPKHSIRRTEAKDGGSICLKQQRGDAPKYKIKLYALSVLKQGTMDQLIRYLTEEQKQGRCDHTIINFLTGLDLLRNVLWTCYETLKLREYSQQDALMFMADLSEIFTLPSVDLKDIRCTISNEMEKKYKDNSSAHLALKYFHSICENEGNNFDSKLYAALHETENQVVMVTIDYFVHLFGAAITRKVNDLKSIFSHDAPMWKGQIPESVWKGELKRLGQIVSVLLKDIKKVVCLQAKYRGVTGINIGACKHLIEETLDVNSRECRFAVQRMFDELRFSFVDLTIIRLIREWIESQDGTGGTICIAVDDLGRQTLETLFVYVKNVEMEKWRVNELRMPPLRKGNVRTQTRWGFESVPPLDITREDATEPIVPSIDMSSDHKVHKRKRRGKKK